MQIAERHRDDGLVVLGVTDAPIDEGLQFLDEDRPPFALLAGAEATREAWGIGVIWGSPSFLVDAAGRIVAEEVIALGDDEFAGLLER